MRNIDVDGLPETVVRALEEFVRELRQQLSPPPPSSTERLQRAFGAWADIPDQKFDHWQQEMQRSRKMSRNELAP